MWGSLISRSSIVEKKIASFSSSEFLITRLVGCYSLTVRCVSQLLIIYCIHWALCCTQTENKNPGLPTISHECNDCIMYSTIFSFSNKLILLFNKTTKSTVQTFKMLQKISMLKTSCSFCWLRNPEQKVSSLHKNIKQHNHCQHW